MIHVPAPAAINGNALTDELAAAGIAEADVVLVGDQLRINADESQRAKVEKVVNAHKPPPPEPDPEEQFRAEIQAAPNLEALKAALLGARGPGAQARRPS